MQIELRNKIERHEAVIGVIGLGYVGLPLCRAFHDAGYPVLGFDVDPAKIDHLAAGRNSLMHLGERLVADMVESGRFDATSDFSRLGEADGVLVCVPTPLIELAGEINHSMPAYVVQRTARALNERRKAVRGARILVLGLAYKPDVDDVRESPSLELIVQFHELGAEVDYHDPHIAATYKMRKYDLGLTSVPLSPERLRAYDAVVVATHPSAYDWEEIARHAPLIIDTRGALRHVAGPREHIVNA